MTIAYDRDAKIRDSIIETNDVTNQPGMVVINPDGSSIVGGGGVGEVEGNVAANDADSGNPVKVGGVYNATLPSYDDGDRTNLQADVGGRLWTNDPSIDLSNTLAAVAQKPIAGSSYTWDIDASSALEASSIIKASAGNIRLFSGKISHTAPTGRYFIQFINSATLPGDGAVTHLVAPVVVEHTNGYYTPIYVEFPENGAYASTGLVWCLSSTEFTKTISGSYVSATVFYK